MLATGSATMDAERAFSQLARSRRIADVIRRIRRHPLECGRLALFDEGAVARRRAARRLVLREIPVSRIRGTVEPSRAAQFDPDFRPGPLARHRWQRVWLAEATGTPLPPISVVEVDDGYVVRDGHHRVSVARARGALTIDATVETPL